MPSMGDAALSLVFPQSPILWVKHLFSVLLRLNRSETKSAFLFPDNPEKKFAKKKAVG